MYGGNHLNVYVSAGTAVSEWEAKSAHYRLIEENETRLFGLSRLDQSLLRARLSVFRPDIASKLFRLGFGSRQGEFDAICHFGIDLLLDRLELLGRSQALLNQTAGKGFNRISLGPKLLFSLFAQLVGVS